MKSKLSWWEYEYLCKDVDFTVLGAGIVGISTAIELKLEKPESKVLVLDKKSFPIGASTKNAGFACFGSISEIVDDLNRYGRKVSEKLIKMRWQGLDILKSRVPSHKMGYEPKPGAEIFDTKNDFDQYECRIDEINKWVAPLVREANCFDSSKGDFGNQIVNRLEGSLNPQKMMIQLEHIARKLGVIFLNGVEIVHIDFDHNILQSTMGNVPFKKLIICTNGFTGAILNDIDVLPARNQVFITNQIPGFYLKHCYHMHKGYVYFKEYDNRLLIGGGRHLDIDGETTSELGNTEEIMSYLKDIVDNVILKGRKYTIEHEWSGILGVGANKMPIVRAIGSNAYIAIRMGGMGVAIGSYIGKVVTAQLLSIDNSAYRLYVS